MIYLDNSATTKPYPEVLKSFQQVSDVYFANPSSIHPLGGEAEKLLQKSREQVADLLGVEAGEIVFTSGGTEGNNTAIKGTALEHASRGKHIITTEIEHPSVLAACGSLEQSGFEVTYLPVDQNGVVSVEDVVKAIREDTILLTIMHVNNELGSIQPVEKIGAIVKDYPKLVFHVDDVQGLGKVPLHLQDSGIDLCTYSGHKIHGLKGTGILYINKQENLSPLLHGGNQEHAIRSGTENLAGFVSMAKALRITLDKQQQSLSKLTQLWGEFRHALVNMDGVIINTPEQAAPHIINFSVPGLKPEILIHMLGRKHIYLSTKSACSSKRSDESKILVACGLSRERAISSLRVSLAYDTTEREQAVFMKELRIAIDELKEVLE